MLKNIKNIINCLSEDEIELIRKSFRKNQRFSKSLKLFKRICQLDYLDDKLMAKDLYNTPPNSSYSHLKGRLRENIIEIIYNSEFSDKTEDSALGDKSKCQKLLMISSMLIEKGLKEEAKSYLKQADQIIDKRQFSMEKFMLHSLQADVSDNPDEHEIIEKDLKADLIEIEELVSTKMEYHNVRLMGKHLEEEYLSAKSPKEVKGSASKYYQLLMEINKFLEVFDYDKAFEYSSTLVQYTSKNEDYFTPSEINEALLVHLRVLIYCNSKKRAIQISDLIESKGLKRRDQEAEFAILKWLMSYSMGDYAQAERYVQHLSMMRGITDPVMRITNYFKLCLMFKQGKYENIRSYLLNDNSLQKLRSPVCLAVKPLEIYCLIELGKNDLAYSKLLAFNQYLKRTTTLNKYRYRFIVKVLFKLFKNNFNYGLTMEFCKAKLHESFMHDNRLMADIPHYEIITIEEWLTMKSVEVHDMQLEVVGQ